VRGSTADGRLGPDLTHVGSRLHIGAGTLHNERDSFLRWIAETDTIKPGVHMPAFRALSAESLSALAAYLDSLQ
jgi:cytochrome c oxidase subunit 2